MDVQGVGAGPPDQGLSNITRAVPLTMGPAGALAQGLAQIDADTVAGLLSQLSASQITALLKIIEPELPPNRIAQLDSLVVDVVSAATAGDVQGAMTKLLALASLDPRRAESVASDSALAPMRNDVDTLIARLTTTARMNAEARFQDATRAAQDWGTADHPVRDVDATTLLLVAGRLIEAGGFANWVHSAEVSQMALDQYRWAPTDIPSQQLVRDGTRIRVGRATSEGRRRMAALLKNLWRRAPLLVLLLGWLAAGLAGAVFAAVFRQDLPASAVGWFFEIWALGFLALVLFGFYMRVRNR